MHAVITGYRPYIHDQIPLDLDVPLISTGFCPSYNKALTPEESAKYKDMAYCSECTWDMWRDIAW